MRRILLLLAVTAVLALPAAAAALPQHRSVPGFLVVRNAQTDAGVAGSAVATVVVNGFVLGNVTQEGAVEIYHLAGSVQAQATGLDVARRAVAWHTVKGVEYTGSGFRFRAVGGVWRIVVYGAGISLYAGGEGHASLHGSVGLPKEDGEFSVDGGPFASLPSGVVPEKFGVK